MASSKNIGDQIFNAVQNAVDSQDFSNLQSTIEKSIGIAAEGIARGLSSASDGIRRGQEQYALAQAKKRREEQMATIYANPSGQRSVGIALVGWGVVLGVPGLAGTIFTIGAGSILVGSILAAATVAGGALFAMGIKRLNLVNRFERYRRRHWPARFLLPRRNRGQHCRHNRKRAPKREGDALARAFQASGTRRR